MPLTHVVRADIGRLAAARSWRIAWGVAMALLGVGVGALVRRPGPAVAVTLGWFAIVEPSLAEVLQRHDRWLPGQASSSLLEPDPMAMTPMWAPGVTLLAWCAVLLVVSARELALAELQ